MRIALIDCDYKRNRKNIFPTLTLMKLSAWHKIKGDVTHLLTYEDYMNGSLFESYDKAYASCIFTENERKAKILANMGVDVGGSGYDMSIKLPAEIEHIMPDYALYGITDTAYGFLSRGCIRKCPFCIVCKKEGTSSYKVADLSEWWSGQKYIKLLDPNILACPEHMKLLEQLADSNARIDVTQGADVRLITPENTALLNQTKIKMLHFAWDNPKDTAIKEKFLWFREHTKIKHNRQLRVYVLTNYWSTLQEDLDRVYWLRQNGYDPYVMVYNKANAPRELKDLQRWVNSKWIFWSCEKFEDYQQSGVKK